MTLTKEDWDSKEADEIGGYLLIGVVGGLCPALLGLLIIMGFGLLPIIINSPNKAEIGRAHV